ncbi:hypothetical protein ACR30L_04005 [Psychromonas sp. PT13]|uniref:hypothetical protein n=1 Tax=Psychromonas sp. PT13 TaxID=3439547 RepID=UPI003EBA980D
MLNKHISNVLLVSPILLLLSSCYAATVKQPSEKSLKERSSVITKTVKKPETRNDWKAVLNWPELCDEGVSHISSFFVGVDVYPWFEERQLVSVVCTTGAYNRGLMFFLETEKNSGQYSLLSFPQFIAADDASGNVETTISGDLTKAPFYQFDQPLLWGSLRSDMSNFTITNNNRYRGLGGCGVLTSYQITDNKVQVSALKIKKDCDETNLPFSEWPKIAESVFSTWPKVILKERG